MGAILTNQSRLLLAIILNAKKVYGKTKLQKLAFLIDREAGSEKFRGLFRFRPYYYGPFSPAVFEKADELREAGLLKVAERETERGGKEVTANDFGLTEEGERVARDFMATLSPEEANELRMLVRKYNFYTLPDLLEYTYTTYPEMARRSRWQRPE